MRALLLNNSYEPLSFISLKRLIKLVVNDKVEIIESWDEKISWAAGSMLFPAIIKLKYYVRRPPARLKFNKKSVFIRDMYSCLYCGIALSASKITIDHIIPKSKGGKITWLNSASCCESCNSKKGNKTLEEALMKLIKEPFVPQITLKNEYILIRPKHIAWNDYFNVEVLPE